MSRADLDDRSSHLQLESDTWHTWAERAEFLNFILVFKISACFEKIAAWWARRCVFLKVVLSYRELFCEIQVPLCFHENTTCGRLGVGTRLV